MLTGKGKRRASTKSAACGGSMCSLPHTVNDDDDAGLVE